jgi:hypothetical protein
MSKKTLEAKLKGAQRQLEEQKTNYETAQYMLMGQAIRFIDDKDYKNLRQFCENYARPKSI